MTTVERPTSVEMWDKLTGTIEHIRAGLLHGGWDDAVWIANVSRRPDLPDDIRKLAGEARAILAQDRR